MRFDNLTVARFAAAFLVFLHHSSPAEYEAVQSPFLKGILANGYVGVSFFFIVSGFVLSASNLDKLAVPTLRGSISFYWKRMARIVPLWALVSLPMILQAAKANDPHLVPFVTFTQAWSPDVSVAFSLLAVAWTLSVEMFFYFLFPFFAAALRYFRGNATGPALIALGLAIPIGGALYFYLTPAALALPVPDPNSAHRWLYRFPVARLGEFIAGIGIFLTIQRCRPRLGRSGALAVLGLATALLVYAMGRLPTGGYLWVAPYALLFTIIVMLLARLETLGLAIKHRLPILLGEASFAFYLIHQFYFKGVLLAPLIAAFGLPIAQVAVFLLTIATSVGLFVAFETPVRIALVGLWKRRKLALEAGFAVSADPASTEAIAISVIAQGSA